MIGCSTPHATPPAPHTAAQVQPAPSASASPGASATANVDASAARAPDGAVAESAPPVTFWEVTGPKPRALAVVIQKHGLRFIDEKRRSHTRYGMIEQTGPQRWEWEIEPRGSGIRCTLEREADQPRATLSCTDGVGAERFSLREPSAERRSELEAIAAGNEPPTDVCRIAEACCAPAFALLKAGCDLSFQFGNPREMDKCAVFLVGIREILKGQKQRLPDACREWPPIR